MRRPTLLVVDDDPDIRALVRAALTADFNIVGEAEDGIRAIELVEELVPDFILMDIAMPRLDGLAATQAISRKHPDVHVVILSAHSRLESVRAALAAGARDFVGKPFEPLELRTTMLEAAQIQTRRRELLRASSRPPGAGIWAFSRATGGVGQTTLVLGLANELVTLGKRVLVVDLHPHFGHVAFYLGLDAPGADLADLAEFPVSLTVGSLGDLVKVHASGVRVLAGPEDLLRGQTMDLHHLIPRILELEDLVDYVLLDLPAGVPDALLPILDAARFLFLVTNGSLGSLKSTKQAYNLFLMLEYPRSKIRPVMTGLHAEESIRRVLDQMLVKSDTPLTQLFPEDEEGAHQAMSLGQPITRIFPKSPFTRAVRKFLAPLLEVSQEDMGVSPDSGLFSSLFGRIFGE